MTEHVLLPKKLTAENGAKYRLSGEFFVVQVHECLYCDDDDIEECELCHGTGEHRQKIPIPWTTIKEIHDKVVAHFSESGQ